MQESRLIAKFQRGGKRRQPAGFSFLTRRCSHDERTRIVKYLIGCREALLADLGGEENLSAQKLMLIDRLISLLGVVRGIEEHHKDNILNRDGTLKPSLGKNYLSYVNSSRQILMCLGLERVTDKIPSIAEIVAEIDLEKDKKVEHKTTNPGGDGHE